MSNNRTRILQSIFIQKLGNTKLNVLQHSKSKYTIFPSWYIALKKSWTLETVVSLMIVAVLQRLSLPCIIVLELFIILPSIWPENFFLFCGFAWKEFPIVLKVYDFTFVCFPLCSSVELTGMSGLRQPSLTCDLSFQNHTKIARMTRKIVWFNPLFALAPGPKCYVTVGGQLILHHAIRNMQNMNLSLLSVDLWHHPCGFLSINYLRFLQAICRVWKPSSFASLMSLRFLASVVQISITLCF